MAATAKSVAGEGHRAGWQRQAESVRQLVSPSVTSPSVSPSENCIELYSRKFDIIVLNVSIIAVQRVATLADNRYTNKFDQNSKCAEL